MAFFGSPLPISSLRFSTVSERATRSSGDIRRKTSASRLTVGATWAKKFRATISTFSAGSSVERHRS
ncbi:hypothetical protein ACM614_14290 [Streptomyces sp. 12297]